jgi:two-component sensor histidine kinase
METSLAVKDVSQPRESDIAEANHRIANSLALLVSMVRMQASQTARQQQPLPAAEVRALLDGIAARINTISQIHRMLSQFPEGDLTNLRPHLRGVTQALVNALSSPQQRLHVADDGEDCMILPRHVQPVMLILCEVFINAMKYAHPSGVPLVMTVTCMSRAEGGSVITIADDGVGLPEGFDPRSGNGLGFRVMRSLAGEIGGQLTFDSTPLGLNVHLVLPPAARN